MRFYLLKNMCWFSNAILDTLVNGQIDTVRLLRKGATYSCRERNLLLSLRWSTNRWNPGRSIQGGRGCCRPVAVGDLFAFARTQLCTVVDECCMLRSNSSKLIAWPMLSDGSLPADACARSSGENQRASWLLVGESPPSRL